MTRRSAVAAVVLATIAGLGLAACSLARRTPAIRYYTLAPPGVPPSALGAPVRVGHFTADQPYASERIAYRTSPYRLDYYTYHRWAADPRRMLAATTRDYLEQGAKEGAGSPPFEIEGHIRRLEEMDGEDSWEGALVLDLKVSRGGKRLLERSYAESEPAGARDPEAVVAALSRALGRILDRLASELAAGD